MSCRRLEAGFTRMPDGLCHGFQPPVTMEMDCLCLFISGWSNPFAGFDVLPLPASHASLASHEPLNPDLFFSQPLLLPV